jgi:hypothetical protein
MDPGSEIRHKSGSGIIIPDSQNRGLCGAGGRRGGGWGEGMCWWQYSAACNKNIKKLKGGVYGKGRYLTLKTETARKLGKNRDGILLFIILLVASFSSNDYDDLYTVLLLLIFKYGRVRKYHLKICWCPISVSNADLLSVSPFRSGPWRTV